jgi:hypothetical protein
MVGFIKGFKSLIPELFQWIILGVISLFVLFRTLENNSEILDFFIALLPVAFILFAVFLLVIKKQLLPAHLLLLFAFFDNGLRDLFVGLLSYHFIIEKMLVKIDMILILTAIVSVYLILMVASYLFDFKIPKIDSYKSVYFPYFIFIIFGYFCFGFTNLIMFLLISLIVLFAGSKLGAISILLSSVIAFPFQIIELFVDKAQDNTMIFDWIIYIGSIYVIYVLIVSFISNYKADPIKLNIPNTENK